MTQYNPPGSPPPMTQYNPPPGSQPFQPQYNNQGSPSQYNPPQGPPPTNLYNNPPQGVPQYSPPPTEHQYNTGQHSQPLPLPATTNIEVHQSSPPPPQVTVIPPVTTTTYMAGPPGTVDTSIPPEKRSFTQITSIEQIWRMPIFYEGRPTWKLCPPPMTQYNPPPGSQSFQPQYNNNQGHPSQYNPPQSPPPANLYNNPPQGVPHYGPPPTEMSRSIITTTAASYHYRAT
ncbi:3434_t:CDS:2 [Diversispora eburnea]|uniref:3434_t:CDS:1 n=1 Tax=Diversispora eburnea TaxID=1213867 RepID=A0A9N8YXV9_9GLOM|nr:3434_t:CDS:2 [Diversispora eburnea]